ncbi:hypothetical protein GIB67_005899 [Kingdonia uniflora]|uniref:Uncharacterized protein n=1 Tax=Kingdonia uniflora TaxID=39325 RepID=A0A7J7MBH2_9MAGN|nr:hypothetical protein GIB67_005899 [Kingdonia uniflora]
MKGNDLEREPASPSKVNSSRNGGNHEIINSGQFLNHSSYSLLNHIRFGAAMTLA